jgi:HAD superfamily hydrolase (TIGR01459 family)
MLMQHLDGIAPLAARYGGIILDLWGVVHDGVRPYPGVIDCMERLREARIPVVLLSNAPRRAAPAAAALAAMGIGATLYRGIVTSGEVTHLLLRTRTHPDFACLGPAFYHLGPERDRSVFEGLDLTEAALPEDADFLLNTGPDDNHEPDDPAAWDDELAACLAARLPMICANPDLEVIRGGRRIICAGTLAQRYRARGGRVIPIGKPDPSIYAYVLALLGTPPSRVLAVGDSLRTDIAGAAAVGADSCWVLGGIHAADLPDRAAVEEAVRKAGLAPVATLPAFRW